MARLTNLLDGGCSPKKVPTPTPPIFMSLANILTGKSLANFQEISGH